MCKTVIFKKDKKGKTTIRELIKICPRLAIDPNYNAIDLDSCLCPLDLPRTALINNFKYRETDYGMAYIFY